MFPVVSSDSSVLVGTVLSIVCFSCFLLPASSLDTTTPLHDEPSTDLQTLLCLKQHLSGPAGMLDSWRNASLQHCSWAGVSCSKRHKSRVVALNLESFELNGQIPSCIANLTFLARMHMPNNQLSGPIPTELGKLNRLQYLNLSSNDLSGVIPSTLSSCSRLQFIDLGGNAFQGDIPSNLSQCLHLQKLILRQNALSGVIPESLGMLHNLSVLHLAKNSLTGEIPLSLGCRSSLRAVVLAHNGLTGPIPPFLSNSSSLQFLDLTENSLGGVIPYTLLNSKSLKTIALGLNNFVGSIPDLSQPNSPLQYLILQSNSLSGEIPSSLGNLSSLIWILLGNNNFQGSVPASVSKIPNLDPIGGLVSYRPAAMAEPAIAIPPPPQIPCRPELASQIHPAPASLISCATHPYCPGSESGPAAGDRHVVPAVAPTPPPPTSPPAQAPAPSPATTSTTGLTPQAPGPAQDASLLLSRPSVAAAQPPSPASPSATIEDEVELLDWGDDDDAFEEEEETLLAEPTAGLDAPPSEPSSAPAPCTPGSGRSPVQGSPARAGTPDAAGASSSWAPAIPSMSMPQPWLSSGVASPHHPELGGAADSCRRGTVPSVPSTALAPARLKSILVRPTPVPTPTAPAAGRRKKKWKKLMLREDSAASCWDLGKSSGAIAPPEPPPSPSWQTARKKYWWRHGGSLQEDGSDNARRNVTNVATGHTMDGREFFKKRFAGRCFRCLGVDHQVAQCRDPIRCLRCKGFGHISRHCRSCRRHPISAKLCSRLTFPPGSIHSRLVFPPLCSANHPTTPPPQNAPSNSAHPAPYTGETECMPGQVADHPTLARVNIVPWCGRCQAPVGDHALMDRGRLNSRSPRRTVRGREALAHASEDWERRRSRSPVIRSRGWSQHRASPVSCDPLLDFYRDSDGDRVLTQEDDPMVHEHNCVRVPPVALLCGSPESIINDRPNSVEYRPVSMVAPAQLTRANEVVFKLGAHGHDNLTADISDQMAIDVMPLVSSKGPDIGDVSDMDDPTTRDATGWDVFDDYATEAEVGGSDQEELDGYAGFCAGIFKPIPAPVLQSPVLPPPTSSKNRRRAAAAPTRSSARQAARPSSIPVAQRAQFKLMRELSFIDAKSAAPAPDAAVTAYINMYGHELPQEAIKALQAATRLGNKELSRALAAIASEPGAVEMEVS